MEIEFNGISNSKLKEICENYGIEADIFPLASRDAICPREVGREFGDGETYYLAEESCWHGYFFCGGFNCGRSSQLPSGSGTIIRSKARVKSAEGRTGNRCESARCFEGSNCDSSSDSSGAFIIFFVIVAVFLLLLFLAPILGPIVALGIELGLAIMLGVFDLITFGIFRKKFKRLIVHFPSPPSDTQLNHIIGGVASFGGLPRRFKSQYGTNGFWLLRTGAYLFIPSLIATFLVLWLQPDSRVLFYVPIFALISSIVLVWTGNFMINLKAKNVSSIA